MSSKFTLYQINNEIEEVISVLTDAMEAENTELVDLLQSELDSLYETQEQKLRGYVHVIKNAEATIAAMSKEATRLNKRVKSLKTLIEWLKNNLLFMLKQRRQEKVQVDHFTISIRQNPESVQVNIPPEDLAEQFQRKRPIEANKPAIKEAFKRGERVAGCEMVRKIGVSIK